jgi:hypothetical protein
MSDSEKPVAEQPPAEEVATNDAPVAAEEAAPAAEEEKTEEPVEEATEEELTGAALKIQSKQRQRVAAAEVAKKREEKADKEADEKKEEPAATEEATPAEEAAPAADSEPAAAEPETQVAPAPLADDVEADLREREDEINYTARDMGRLRGEFAFNLRKLQDSFYPRVYPFLNAVHMNSYYQQLLDAEIQWMVKKVVAMEQHKAGFFELRDMAAAKKELFDAINPAFEEAFLVMDGVTKQELAVLRGYENPPQVVLDTIEAVMIVRGEEDTSLDASRVMLSETYYYSFFTRKCRSQTKNGDLSEAQLEALERFLLSPDNTPENVGRASTPCGAMAKWLHSLNLFYHFERLTAVKSERLEDLKEDLMQRRLRMQDKKEEIRGAQEKLDDLKLELRECELDLRDRYDVTMVPLHDVFLDANVKFNDLFCSPRRQRAEGQESP